MWGRKGRLAYICFGKEVNMVWKRPYSCRSYCTCDHYFVWEESCCARKAQLLAAVLITKFWYISKILCTWKCIPPSAEHHCSLQRRLHLLGKMDVFTYMLPLSVSKNTTSFCLDPMLGALIERSGKPPDLTYLSVALKYQHLREALRVNPITVCKMLTEFASFTDERCCLNI